MALKTLNSALIRQALARGYASAAAPDQKVPTGILANKVTAIAYNNCSPITRVTVAFKAGSRYERPTELGLTHVLRSAAGLTTKNSSGFMTSRKLAQIGAQLSASTDKEILYYTLEVTQEHLEAAIEYLNNVVCNQEFRPWELDDNNPRIKYEVATVPPQVMAVDLMHQAAFRRGLGNPLYISPNRIGKISSESLQHFACNYITGNRCAVAVVGDEIDKANLIGQVLDLPKSDGQETPSKYFGGEQRVECGGDLAHVAVAVLGAPANSTESLALAVAAKALGNGPSIKWGSDRSPLASALGNIGPFAAAGFNVSYSDAGLFGIVLSVPKDEAAKAVENAVKCLKSSNSIPDTAIMAGKAALKLQVLSEAEDGANLSENLAAQLLTYGCVRSPVAIASAVDQVTPQQVRDVLSKVALGKVSMGATGNIANVPFVDEL